MLASASRFAFLCVVAYWTYKSYRGWHQKQLREQLSRLAAQQQFKVVIIGAGFSGLTAAVRLKELGVPFVLYEKAKRVGGTWFHNRYAGCTCDIPGALYSFSFNPNPYWATNYPRQPEILEYIEATARKFDLYQHIRFGHEVTAAEFNTQTHQWQLTLECESCSDSDGGTSTIGVIKDQANFLIGGFGALHTPSTPVFPGQQSFRGESFHTAEWKEDFDWKNKNIIVIGNAASALQAIPVIADGSKHLTVFQRTPNWVFPRFDGAIPKWLQTLFAYFPITQLLVRTMFYVQLEILFQTVFKGYKTMNLGLPAQEYLRSCLQGRDDLIKKLTPTYPLGCKRILVSGDFYQSFLRQNVSLVTDGIAKIVEDGIVDGAGTRHLADVIIYATGFHPMQGYPIMKGVDGKDLVTEKWKPSHPAAYLGITCPTYPNFSIMLGPNTALGHNSVILMIEWQCEYTMQMIQHMLQHNVKALDVKPEVCDAFNRTLQGELSKSVWSVSNCKSWYQTENGFNYTLWSGSTMSYRAAVARFNPADYYIVR